jgi:hypothetical protein
MAARTPRRALLALQLAALCAICFSVLGQDAGAESTTDCTPEGIPASVRLHVLHVATKCCEGYTYTAATALTQLESGNPLHETCTMVHHSEESAFVVAHRALINVQGSMIVSNAAALDDATTARTSAYLPLEL